MTTDCARRGVRAIGCLDNGCDMQFGFGSFDILRRRHACGDEIGEGDKLECRIAVAVVGAGNERMGVDHTVASQVVVGVDKESVSAYKADEKQKQTDGYFALGLSHIGCKIKQTFGYGAYPILSKGKNFTKMKPEVSLYGCLRFKD